MQLEGAARYIGRTPGQREREQGCGGDDSARNERNEKRMKSPERVSEWEASEGGAAHDKHLSRQFGTA